MRIEFVITSESANIGIDPFRGRAASRLRLKNSGARGPLYFHPSAFACACFLAASPARLLTNLDF
jgi:hypothetical protein